MNPFTTALNEALGRGPDSLPYDGKQKPGEWVYDRPKGMKPIVKPDPLPDGPLSIEDIRDCVRYNELGFCIFSFIPYERIADEQLSGKWYKARNAMQEVAAYLEETK